jgi:hypothetical protein
METIHGREGVPGGRVEELLGAIESVRVVVELLGPPTLGGSWPTGQRAMEA